MKQKSKSEGITLISLVITIVILLILAGVAIGQITGNGLFNKAQLAVEKYKKAQELENEKLKELKEYYYQEGSTENQEGNTESQEDVSNEIEEGDSETTKYKKEIAKKLTELGVKTVYKQSVEDFISNIRILADKNYKEGKESDIVKLKSDLISRYEQHLSLAKIEGYENFDEEDFIIGNKNMLWVNTYDGGDIFEMTKLYDKTTGLLNLGILRGTVRKNQWTFYNTFDLYAIKRKVIQVQGKNSGFTGESEELDYFITKLSEILKEYGIEDTYPTTEKTAEEMINSIKKWQEINLKKEYQHIKY